MGSGYGGIYASTHGGRLYGKISEPLGLTAELPDVDQAMRAVLLLAGAEAVGSAVGPLSEAALGDLQRLLGEAVARGRAGELLGLPEVDEVRLGDAIRDWWRVLVDDQVAARAAELDLDLDTDPDDPKPGIYENCKFAEAALGTALPGTVPGAEPSQRVPRFTFHEEAGGGHFGVKDKPSRKSKGLPVFVMENCSEVGGATLVGWAMFAALGRGGNVRLMEDKREGGTGDTKYDGVICELDDGTRIIWRWKTGTESSPALEVRDSADMRVARHKIHFYAEESKMREKDK